MRRAKLAASTRRFLFGGRLWWAALVYVAVLMAAEIAWDYEPPWMSSGLFLPLAAGYLWFSHRHRVWIVRDSDGISVTRRRLGRPLLRQYPPATTIVFDGARPAWWRSDRSLIIGSDTYAVHNDWQKTAVVLADQARWAVHAQTKLPDRNSG